MRTHDTRRCAGAAHPRARLSDAQVTWIRDQWDAGLLSLREIAEVLQRAGTPTTRSTVWSIVTYRTRFLVTPGPAWVPPNGP